MTDLTDRSDARPAGRIGAPPHGPGLTAGPTVVALVAHARSVPTRERAAFAAALHALSPADGMLIVETCHRVEAYVAPASFDPRRLPSPPSGARQLSDVDAVRHLIAVACGLDSAVLGEDQILHQLRVAHADRHAAGGLDPVLDRLFQAALHAGRVARSWFDGNTRSLSDVALDRIAAEAGPLEGRPVLVVGVGKMGRLAALAAARRGARVVVTNRTREHAVALAREIGGEVVPFGDDGCVPSVCGIVVAIAGEWRVGEADRARLVRERPTVVDLSSPSAVPAGLRSGLGDRFVSIDDLADLRQLDVPERLVRRLEGLVSDTGREYCRWLRTRESVPAIQALATAAEARRAEEVEWLLRRMPDLGPEDRAVVEQMSHRLVAGLLHRPMAAMNADETGRLEQAARDLFRI